ASERGQREHAARHSQKCPARSSHCELLLFGVTDFLRDCRQPRSFDAMAGTLDLSNSFMVFYVMSFRNSRSIKLAQLRTFVTVAESGGFARAAGRLNLTQSAASRQIMALESVLGLPLFARDGQHTTLTLEGEDLLRRSRRLLADADSLAERAHALKGGQTGILRISASPQVLENVLAPFLPGYLQAHPG